MRRPSLKIRITAWFALMMFVIEALHYLFPVCFFSACDQS